MMKIITILLFLLVLHQISFSQVNDSLPSLGSDTLDVPTEKLPVLQDTLQYNDTVIRNRKNGLDTLIKKRVHSPQKATILSAAMPGLGQIYNKKYWKVPIVYGAIGIPAYLFFYNKSWYNKTRYALSIVTNGRLDSDSVNNVDPQLKPLLRADAENAIIQYRNQFRRNMDYSVLVTLIMWGLNVVDATVDGHLKGFDVSDELSLHISPTIIPGSPGPAVSFVFNFK